MMRGVLVVLLWLNLLGSATCVALGQQQPTAADSGATQEKTGQEKSAQEKTAQEKTAANDPSAEAWQMLNEALNGNDAAKRTEAVSALSVAGPSAPIPVLEKLLQDHEPSVRQAAVVALGELKSRRSMPKLRRALDDEDAEVSFSAARVLWEMGDRSGRMVLIEVLAGERTATQGAAQGQIQGFKKKLKNPAALALFGIKQSGVLGPFGIGLSLAEELRKDKSASARILAADALAKDRDAASAQELEDALGDKNWAVRAMAAQSVAKRNYRHSIPALRDLLADKNEVVKYTAAAAIVRLTRASYAGKR
jgi:HEAT repeat protein